jgi:hypothetical protein
VSEPRPRRTLVVVTIVVATFVGLLAVFAIWAKRQVLETDTWVDTSSQVLEDSDVQEALSAFLVDALYSSVNVEGELQAKLPPQAQALAGPAAAGLRELAGRLALEALQRPKVQELWATANRTAHQTLINVVEGGGDTVSTEGGDVTLDVGSIVEQLGDRAGIDVAGKVPPSVSEIVIMRSDQLEVAQDGVNLLRKLVIVLSALALALWGLAIYLARGWRRQAVRAVGWSFIVIGILVLAIRSIAGGYLVDSLANSTSVEPAVDSVWSIGTSLLHDGALAMIGYGVVIIAGAWLVGPGSLATEGRRAIAPVVERRLVGYAVLAVLVLLIFWWNPTPGTSRLVPSLLLILLFVAGFEAIRAQAVKDFPDETWERLSERWQGAGSGVAARIRERRAARVERVKAHAAQARSGLAKDTTPTGDDRLDQLERLAKLRESGVLTDAELEREKQRVLA